MISFWNIVSPIELRFILDQEKYSPDYIFLINLVSWISQPLEVWLNKICNKADLLEWLSSVGLPAFAGLSFWIEKWVRDYTRGNQMPYRRSSHTVYTAIYADWITSPRICLFNLWSSCCPITDQIFFVFVLITERAHWDTMHSAHISNNEQSTELWNAFIQNTMNFS